MRSFYFGRFQQLELIVTVLAEVIHINNFSSMKEHIMLFNSIKTSTFKNFMNFGNVCKYISFTYILVSVFFYLGLTIYNENNAIKC